MKILLRVRTAGKTELELQSTTGDLPERFIIPLAQWICAAEKSRVQLGDLRRMNSREPIQKNAASRLTGTPFLIPLYYTTNYRGFAQPKTA